MIIFKLRNFFVKHAVKISLKPTTTKRQNGKFKLYKVFLALVSKDLIIATKLGYAVKKDQQRTVTQLQPICFPSLQASASLICTEHKIYIFFYARPAVRFSKPLDTCHVATRHTHTHKKRTRMVRNLYAKTMLEKGSLPSWENRWKIAAFFLTTDEKRDFGANPPLCGWKMV